MFGKVDLCVNVGRKSYVIRAKCPKLDFETWTLEQRDFPKGAMISGLNRTYWNFVDRWWWDNDGLNVTQVHALLVTQLQRQQSRIERAEAMVAMGLEPQQAVRRPIPDDVKQFVWMRVVAAVETAVRRPSCSSITSCRSRWAVRRTPTTFRSSAVRATGERVRDSRCARTPNEKRCGADRSRRCVLRERRCLNDLKHPVGPSPRMVMKPVAQSRPRPRARVAGLAAVE
jgi:hypothetical protein